MAYEIEDIRKSQQIFYYLLKHRELKDGEEVDLYRAYTENETVMNLVKSQGDAANSDIVRYGSTIYLIPKENNDFLGYSKSQLKASLCRSGATDKDYYLSQFVIITLLVEFYDAQGSSSKSRDFIKVGELLNCLSSRLQEGVLKEQRIEEGRLGEQQVKTKGLAFTDMSQAFEALRSEEKGSRAKTTKEGFLYTILTFLQKQGLIEYAEADEMIRTTKKLDNFMDFNLLNKNNYNRVLSVLEVEKHE